MTTQRKKVTHHDHHIIPKHAGGTDDPSNIVSLSISEHAEAHRVLFETHGRWEDELAWKALSGQLGKEEIIWQAMSQGGKKSGGGKKCASENIGFIRKGTEQHREWGKMTVAAKAGIHSEDWDKAIGGRIGGNKCRDEKIGWHADPGMGSRGTIWISKDDVEVKCYDHELLDRINEGWEVGRSESFRSKAIDHGNNCVKNKVGIHSDAFDTGKSSRGTKWINKDGIRKKCKPEELEQKIQEGWQPGRTQAHLRYKRSSRRKNK